MLERAGEAGDIEEIGGRQAAGERDDLGAAGQRQQVADRRACDSGEAGGGRGQRGVRHDKSPQING
ncbi:hypothetical protein [Fodinicola feengrottensis]|uniref:hypothetical protein n=1 Tax=Fodinicola feengrottensis TaxID=435914 RepID=UPI002442B90E|nr:hypothetical protein [Fodinicola feengrottensis]